MPFFTNEGLIVVEPAQPHQHILCGNRFHREGPVLLALTVFKNNPAGSGDYA